MKNNIKKFRKKAGLSQSELADKVNVSPQIISQYENGGRQPKLDTAISLMNVLNASISDIAPEYVNEINDLNKMISSKKVDLENDDYNKLNLDLLSAVQNFKDIAFKLNDTTKNESFSLLNDFSAMLLTYISIDLNINKDEENMPDRQEAADITFYKSILKLKEFTDSIKNNEKR